MVNITIERLSFRYEAEPGRRGAPPAPLVLDGVDLRVPSGGILALLGPSGSGKTTLLSVVAGFLTPHAGEVRFDERVVSSPSTNVRPRDRGIGMVFQDLALWPHLTVKAHLDFVLGGRGVRRKERRRRREEILALVELEGLAGKRPGQLSGGEAQRLALARALVVRPRVLLLDEPLGGLDERLRRKLLALIQDVQERTRATTIYVTHDAAEAETLTAAARQPPGRPRCTVLRWPAGNGPR